MLPPSIIRFAPFIIAAASLARNTAASATSAGCAKRRVGMPARAFSPFSPAQFTRASFDLRGINSRRSHWDHLAAQRHYGGLIHRLVAELLLSARALDQRDRDRVIDAELALKAVFWRFSCPSAPAPEDGL